MQRQNWNQSSKSILKIKPQSPKVNLFLKPKVKQIGDFKKLRSKKLKEFKSWKEVPKKVLHHPLILLFIQNITLF
jgi:hypothetical protein